MATVRQTPASRPRIEKHRGGKPLINSKTRAVGEITRPSSDLSTPLGQWFGLTHDRDAVQRRPPDAGPGRGPAGSRALEIETAAFRGGSAGCGHPACPQRRPSFRACAEGASVCGSCQGAVSGSGGTGGRGRMSSGGRMRCRLGVRAYHFAGEPRVSNRGSAGAGVKPLPECASEMSRQGGSRKTPIQNPHRDGASGPQSRNT